MESLDSSQRPPQQQYKRNVRERENTEAQRALEAEIAEEDRVRSEKARTVLNKVVKIPKKSRGNNFNI